MFIPNKSVGAPVVLAMGMAGAIDIGERKAAWTTSIVSAISNTARVRRVTRVVVIVLISIARTKRFVDRAIGSSTFEARGARDAIWHGGIEDLGRQ